MSSSSILQVGKAEALDRVNITSYHFLNTCESAGTVLIVNIITINL